MVLDMTTAIGKGIEKCGFPEMTVIGMDLRPRLALGRLAMYFVVEGPHVIVIKDPLRVDDPVWEYAVRAGFSTLPYAPMRPVALPGVPPADTQHV